MDKPEFHKRRDYYVPQFFTLPEFQSRRGGPDLLKRLVEHIALGVQGGAPLGVMACDISDLRKKWFRRTVGFEVWGEEGRHARGYVNFLRGTKDRVNKNLGGVTRVFILNQGRKRRLNKAWKALNAHLAAGAHLAFLPTNQAIDNWKDNDFLLVDGAIGFRLPIDCRSFSGRGLSGSRNLISKEEVTGEFQRRFDAVRQKAEAFMAATLTSKQQFITSASDADAKEELFCCLFCGRFRDGRFTGAAGHAASATKGSLTNQQLQRLLCKAQCKFFQKR